MGILPLGLHLWQRVTEANEIPLAEDESDLILIHSNVHPLPIALRKHSHFLSGAMKKRVCCWSSFQGNNLKGNSHNGHLLQTDCYGKTLQYMSPNHSHMNEQVNLMFVHLYLMDKLILAFNFDIYLHTLH